jgi:hypothetical protein
MHCVPLLRTIHKKHHNLIPVHTFGAYYNSAFEALFLGGCLGVFSIVVCGLSVLELSIAASIGTFFTVLDHTPAAFFSGEEGDLSDHEIHHNVCSNCNFSQPFWPFLDWLFGTRFEDVMRKEGKDPEKYRKRKVRYRMHCHGSFRFRGCFVFVCSDEEITHNRTCSMIFDVHFGDTRYDLTPAKKKRLPNDHIEEQYTTTKIIWLQTQDKRRQI